jgi:hypothetical protein
LKQVCVAGLLRELVLSQQKTMFYTVTVSSSPPSPSLADITRKIAPNLKVPDHHITACCLSSRLIGQCGGSVQEVDLMALLVERV